MLLDLMWVRLSDKTGLPANELGATSADVKVGELLLTPKIGYELIHMEKLKDDALSGFRYWHLGQNVKFNPSNLGLNFSVSQNWASPLVGGRIVTALVAGFEVTIAGDVGGWNVGSQLEYQVVGLPEFLSSLPRIPRADEGQESQSKSASRPPVESPGRLG